MRGLNEAVIELEQFIYCLIRKEKISFHLRLINIYKSKFIYN